METLFPVQWTGDGVSYLGRCISAGLRHCEYLQSHSLGFARLIDGLHCTS
jgi:hypothetical protein